MIAMRQSVDVERPVKAAPLKDPLSFKDGVGEARQSKMVAIHSINRNDALSISDQAPGGKYRERPIFGTYAIDSSAGSIGIISVQEA